MTKSPCRPLRSSVHSSDRELSIPRSNSSPLHLRQLQHSTSSCMPTTLDSSLPRSSDYCYGLGNEDSELMAGPRSFPSWHNLEVPSDHSQLPRHLSTLYGSFNEDLHSSVESSIGAKSARPSPCWGAEDMAQSSYSPSLQNSCLYPSLNNIGGSHNQWDSPHYSFGYPTPQSESPLSPPQQAYVEFPLLSFRGTPEQSGPYLAPDLPGVQEEFEGLSPFGRQFSHKLRAPSPGESQHQHARNEDDQQADIAHDEVDEDGSVNSEPYAQLIFKALRSAPGHKMVLKDIYQWFEKHTNKARGGSKGWQNSIRHNLSMNGVSLPYDWHVMMKLIAHRVSRKLIRIFLPMKPKGDSSGYWSLRHSLMGSSLPPDTANRDPTSGSPKPDFQHRSVSDRVHEVAKLLEMPQRLDGLQDSTFLGRGSPRTSRFKASKRRYRIWPISPLHLRVFGRQTGWIHSSAATVRP